MTTQRRTPSIRVGDVAGLMASVDACPHRVWHTGRHSSLLRTGQPIEAEPAQGSVVRRLAAALERDHLGGLSLPPQRLRGHRVEERRTSQGPARHHHEGYRRVCHGLRRPRP